MRDIVLIVLMMVVSAATARAERIVAECEDNHFYSHSFSEEESVFCKTGIMNQSLSNRRYWRYIARNGECVLLLKSISETKVGEDVYVPQGMVIEDMEVYKSDITLPARLEYLYNSDPLVGIDEGALQGSVSSLTLESGGGVFTFGEQSWKIDTYNLNRPACFLSPVKEEAKINLSTEVTSWPRGLYIEGKSELTLPSHITALPDRCFYGAKGLEKVNMPEGLKHIGKDCFAYSDMTTLRLPYYIEEVGEGAFRESALRWVTLPWLDGDQHLDASKYNPTQWARDAQWKNCYIQVPACVDYNKGMYKHFVAYKSKFQPSEYYWLWHDGRMVSMDIKYRGTLSKPQMATNDVLVTTLYAGIDEGENVVVEGQATDKSTVFKCAHLVVDETATHEAGGAFVMPVDAYCNRVTFKTQRRGLMETKLPFPVRSDLSKLVAHRDITLDGQGTRCLPVDELPALCTTVLLKVNGRESIDVVEAAEDGNYTNEHHLVRATEAMAFETYDDFGSVAGHQMGYPHKTEMTLPDVDDEGSYAIRTLGDLYFFEAYAPATTGKVDLQADLYQPAGETWHTAESFGGRLNGRGHKIENLTVVEGKDTERLAFIGELKAGGVVERLSIAGRVEQDINNNKVYTDAAGLVARSQGHIEACTVTMNVGAKARNAGIVVGSLGMSLDAPEANLVVGHLKAYEDLGEEGRYGVIYGGWDRSEEQMNEVLTNAGLLNDLNKFDINLRTNYISNDTYVMTGNEMSATVNYTSPYNYTVLRNLWDCDFNDVFSANYLLYHKVELKELSSGAWAKKMKYKHVDLRQNVSDQMAPLDSIPHPYTDDKMHSINTRPENRSYHGVRLEAHSCIDYSGDSICGYCGLYTENAYASVTLNTADELRAFAAEVNAPATEEQDGSRPKKSWYVCLGADIDLGGTAWTPIGNNPGVTYEQLAVHGVRYDGIAFRGVFDGRGHSIKGLKVESDEANQGLFGVVHDNALICNLRLEGEVRGGQRTGAVAGLLSRSEVSSVVSEVDVRGTGQTGGLIGAMVGAHARLANSICLGRVAETEGSRGMQTGRVVGQADGRHQGWDIQPVTIQNVYIPQTESTLYWVGSGTVDGSRITEAAPASFRNDSVNQMMKKEYYYTLLSTAYQLTSKAKMPQLAVDQTPVAPEEPVVTDDEELIVSDGYYQISNAAQLRKFAQLVNSQKDARTVINARLTADIDLDCQTKGNWTGMGTAKVPYNGTFEGGGHRISGLIVDDTKAAFSGLFAVASKATITGLVLEGSGITSGGHVGAIVGAAQNNTIIRDCLVDCPVTCTDKQKTAGGVAGLLNSNAQVHNCLVLSAVTSTGSAEKAGAIVGTCSASNGKASMCSYLDASNSRAYASTSVAKNFSQCEACSEEQLRSGATAYALSQNTPGGAVSQWGQTFGRDERPRLGGKSVHRTAEGYDFDYYNVDTTTVVTDNGKKEEKQLTYTVAQLRLDDTKDQLRLPFDVHRLYAAAVSYEREALMGYNSICLPVDLRQEQMPEGLVLARLAVTDTWTADDRKQTLRFVRTDMLPAGTPGLIVPKDAGDKSSYSLKLEARSEDSGKGAMPIDYNAQPTDEQGSVKLTGTYQTQAIGEGHYKISDEGSMLLRTTAKSHVYPYRWYLTIGGTRAAGLEACDISLESDEQRDGQQGLGERRYDLLGRPVTGAGRTRGIVVRRGKKMVNGLR